MPRFDSTGSLQVIYTDKSFGTDSLSFNTMTLLEGVPSESQIEVRYNAVLFSTDAGLNTVYSFDDDTFGLSAEVTDQFRTLSNPNASFVGDAEIAFNDVNSTVVVPAPVSMSFNPPVEVGDVSFPTLYYVNPQPSVAEPIELRRSTNVTDAVVEYQAGSRLTSDLLNLSSNQSLYAIQELTEYGALASEGGGGGGGGSQSLTEISGATFLAGDGDGNVKWLNGQLRSTTDAPGVLPLTDSLPGGYILITDPSAVSATGADWKELTTDLVIDLNAMLPLDQILLMLNDKAQFFSNGGAAGLLVNGGAADKVTVTAASIDLVGAVNIGNLNGGAAITSNSSIGDLADVDLTSVVPESGKVLGYDGNNWVTTSAGIVPPIRSDFGTPLTAANASTYTPTIVGTSANGNNVYEVYEEVTGAFSGGGSQILLFTNDFSNQVGVVNVEAEIIRALDGSGNNTEYRGQAGPALFGFFIAMSATGYPAGALTLGRNGVANITTNFGAGSVIGIRTRYELP